MTTAAVNAVAEKNGAFEGQLGTLKNADTVLCIGATSSSVRSENSANAAAVASKVPAACRSRMDRGKRSQRGSMPTHNEFLFRRHASAKRSAK